VGAAAGLLLIAVTTAVVLDAGQPFGWDAAVHEWALQVRTPAVTTAAQWLTATGPGLPAYALAATAGGFGGGQRRWQAGVPIAVAALAVVQLLRLGFALIVRPRPPSADWATAAGGFSFPSGHTTTSATVGVLLVVALRRRATFRAAVIVGTPAALGWAVGVGLTRVYLTKVVQEHVGHPSDATANG
jgi:membrane-associated phospholipid phosphatase